MNKKDYSVKPITRNDCEFFVLNIHYAKRYPSISYAYGLFQDDKLVGIVTYGTPPSPPLRRGIAGDKFKDKVLELNRLCLLNNKKNEASFLVSKSLSLLKEKGNFIIISFADTDQGHVGKVYQAANFTYHGLSAKRTDWKVEGKEHLHGMSIADEFRGMKDRAKLMRKKYGDGFYLKPRPRKHRYIYLVGNKNFKKMANKSIKYKKQKYPK